MVKKIKMGFTNFINKFKKNTDDELPMYPVLNGVQIMSQMGEDLANIMRSLSNLQIEDIRIGLPDYKVEKVPINIPLCNSITKKGKAISFSKVTERVYRTEYIFETYVTTSIFTIGIDDNLWKFTFYPYIIYKSMLRHDKIIDICNRLIEASIKVVNLDKLSRIPIEIESIIDDDKLTNKVYEGTIKLFGKSDIYNIPKINLLLPNPFEPKADLIEHAFNEFDLDDETYNESFIVDIIRKSKVSDKDKEDYLNFNLDVISKKTVGEIIDFTKAHSDN